MLLRYLKGNESESKSQQELANDAESLSCCVTSKVMNLKANHNRDYSAEQMRQVVALPQR